MCPGENEGQNRTSILTNNRSKMCKNLFGKEAFIQEIIFKNILIPGQLATLSSET